MDNYYRQQPCNRGNMNCNCNMPGQNSQPDSCPYQGVDRLPLAMAYVPWQQWQKLYDPAKGLKVGTIFAELDLPFCERSCLNS